MKPTRTRVVVDKPSRRGCRTCKLRKIKCDEARPSCRKCSSTGRCCDGYEFSPEPSKSHGSRQLLPNPGRSTTSSLVLRPRTETLPIDTTACERDAFDFFVAVGAPDLFRISPTKAWIPLAIQVSGTEPAVFHAVTAFATLQRSLTLTLHKVLEPPRARHNLDFAVQQFTKASSALHRYIGRHEQTHAIDMEPVLLCAVLFLCFELLRGKYQNAIAHLYFGRKMISDLKASQGKANVSSALSVLPGQKILSGDLMDKFNHAFHVLGNSVILSDQSSGLDQDTQLLHSNLPHSLPTVFTSLEQALQHLNMLSSARSRLRAELVATAEERIRPDHKHTLEPGALLCVTHCLTRAVAASSSSTTQHRIQDLISAHHAWLSALSDLETTVGPSNNAQSFLLVTVLKVKHFLALHTLQTCVSVRETDHDAFIPAFKEMVQLIDRFFVIEAANMIPGVTGPTLPLHPNVQNQDSFSVEPAILPTMALIAFKCRDSILRHKVITLLRSSKRREAGLFGSAMAYFIEQIIEIEECRARAITCVPSGEPLRADQVPEAARFLDIAMRGETPKCTMVAAARFRHDEGDGALEVRQWAWKSGYPVVLEDIGSRVLDYTS